MAETGTSIQKQEISNLRLEISADRLSAEVRCAIDQCVDPAFWAELELVLSAQKITERVDQSVLERLAGETTPDGDRRITLVVARGTPPRPPKPFRLEWSADYFATGQYVDPCTHRIDHHRKAAATSVAKDALIVVVHPPEPGVPGTDIYGRTLVAPLPQICPIKPGRNVAWDAVSSGFRAQCAGRVRLQNNVLEVLDIYRVTGDVGPATGNIEHGGSLVVQGGVTSEFSVRVGGDMEVAEGIGAADIECGGDLVATKGIYGNLGKRVQVGGSLHARYIEQATIRCGGDVIVDTEILNCSVQSAARLVCAGTVVGGELMAAVSLRVGEAGSRAESATTLIAGIDYRVAGELREVLQKVVRAKEQVDRLAAESKRLTQLGPAMTHQQRERQTELSFLISDAQDELSTHTTRKLELAEQLNAHRGAEIVIEKKLHAGTTLRITERNRVITETMTGPITARLGATCDGIVITPSEPPTKD